MSIKFADNCLTTLAGGLGPTTTVITVAAGTGTKYPTVVGGTGNYFIITLENASGVRELVRVDNHGAGTDVFGDVTYPCTRGYGGSSAQTWLTGDSCDLRLPAFAIGVISDAAGVVNTPAGNIAAVTVQAAINELDGEKAGLALNNTFSGVTTYTNAVNEAQGANIASAATTDIGAATGNLVQITGTTTITSFGTVQAGTRRRLRFSGSLTITFHSTAMVLPGNASIITQANDVAEFYSLGGGNWLCTGYQRQNGARLDLQGADVASAATTDLGAAQGNFVNVTGTTTITALGTTQVGTMKIVQFAGVLTLTHNATSLIIPGGQNVLTAAGDLVGFICYGTPGTTSANWRCFFYTVGAVGFAAMAQGKFSYWIPAFGMRPSMTNGCAPLAQIAMGGSQPDMFSLDFDPTTQEFAEYYLWMPKSWNEGTVTFQALWSHGATATNFGVVWGLRGAAISDGENHALAFGTAAEVADTGGNTNYNFQTAESAAITIAGTPAVNDLVCIQVYRKPADASDTLAVDARLLGLKVFLTINAANDA